MFDYIKFVYVPQRKHATNGMLSPIAFERQQKLKLEGAYKSWGYSKQRLPHIAVQLLLSAYHVRNALHTGAIPRDLRS